MSKDPAFLFYPNDYLGGTMGMTFEQKGAYIELLMTQFNRGHMTSHMIGQVLGQNGGQIWETIKDKFEIDAAGKYYNKRLEDEQTKRKTFTDSRKNNLEGKNQYSDKKGHTTSHMTSHMENRDEDVNDNKVRVKYTADFLEFWGAYPNKIGKDAAFSKWKAKKGKPKIAEILEKIEAQKKTEQWRKDGGQFIPNPATYINQARWFDEVKVVSNKPDFTM